MPVIEAQCASTLVPHDHRHINHDRMICRSIPTATHRTLIGACAAPKAVIINSVAYCELCDMDREFCEHGLLERRTQAAAVGGQLLVSPQGKVHFSGCPHKGDDPDYRRWATLDMPRAWERPGNGERLVGTGGGRPDLVARARCQDCVSHGPW
jgi:hypothetical protein